MKKYFFLLLILASCAQEETNSRKNPEVPDLSALIERQAFLLDSLDADVKKIVALNDKKDTTISAEIDWEDELQIFKEADISNIRYSRLYIKEEEGQNTFILRLTGGSDEPVKFLKYTMTGERISMIEGKIEIDNLLYNRHIWLRLEFAERQGEWLISSYRVAGKTAILLFPDRIYSIWGEPLMENRF